MMFGCKGRRASHDYLCFFLFPLSLSLSLLLLRCRRHFGQISEQVSFQKEESDERKIEKIRVAAAEGDRVWVKISGIHTEQRTGRVKISGSMLAVDQVLALRYIYVYWRSLACTKVKPPAPRSVLLRRLARTSIPTI